MSRLLRALAALRHRRRRGYALTQLWIRCDEPAPPGRNAVCFRRDGHDGPHHWAFL